MHPLHYDLKKVLKPWFYHFGIRMRSRSQLTMFLSHCSAQKRFCYVVSSARNLFFQNSISIARYVVRNTYVATPPSSIFIGKRTHCATFLNATLLGLCKRKSNLIFVRKFLTSNSLRQVHHQFTSKPDHTSLILYFSSAFIVMIGLAYAAVPLYRMFCQATGLGGDPSLGHKVALMETMAPIRERQIHVSFNADHHSSMQWNFKPSQREITVVPGETALAFYTAKNPTDKPIVGIATYNVVPFQAGLYFNKIQCFCFEEQWLNPKEEVDMPVFFYIDPDYDSDPQLANTDNIILSYTFFKAEEGQTIPLPGFMKANSVVNLNQKTNE